MDDAGCLSSRRFLSHPALARAIGYFCSDGAPRKNGGPLDGMRTLLPGHDRKACLAPTVVLRRAGEVLQRRGAEEEQRIR